MFVLLKFKLNTPGLLPIELFACQGQLVRTTAEQ